MITVYVSKLVPGMLQVLPVPVDLENWTITEFPHDIEDLYKYVYNAVTQEYELNVVPPQGLPYNPRRIPVLSFRRRLTSTVKISIYELAKVSVEIQIMLDELNLVETGVLLDDPEVIYGLNMLVQVGILTEQRVQEILRDGEPNEY